MFLERLQRLFAENPRRETLHIGDEVHLHGEVIGLANARGEVRILLRGRPGYRPVRALVTSGLLWPSRRNRWRRFWARLRVWWLCRVLRQVGPPCS